MITQQPYEPFSDFGSDGLADKDEPGYDPVTNPDPNHDDYQYLRNPHGTDNNGTWDPGEPFDDFGLDGIAGTCVGRKTLAWASATAGDWPCEAATASGTSRRTSSAGTKTTSRRASPRSPTISART